MANAPLTANVCTECDGTGQAALESSPRGHQMGDCPKCTRACAACSTRIFNIDATDGCCADCIKEMKKPQSLPPPYRPFRRPSSPSDYDTNAEREMDR